MALVTVFAINRFSVFFFTSEKKFCSEKSILLPFSYPISIRYYQKLQQCVLCCRKSTKIYVFRLFPSSYIQWTHFGIYCAVHQFLSVCKILFFCKELQKATMTSVRAKNIKDFHLPLQLRFAPHFFNVQISNIRM